MARWIVDKAIEEKKSIIISAQGEAEAAKLIADAVSLHAPYAWGLGFRAKLTLTLMP
jgi:regulator of protease activity HflC (stomatin/prohibitin superfamily)